MRHLRLISGDVAVFGLGGDRLAAQHADLIAHVRDLAVVGLLEVVRHLRRLRAVFRSVLARADACRPDLAVLVDYPDFNLRLAHALAKRRIPVAYYVSPQVWAWRAGRVRDIRATVSHMIVIFPFETEIYRAAGVPVSFVGHPLVELARPAADREAFLASCGLDPRRAVLAVLPGSRPQEVAHNLPPLAAAVRQLQSARPDLQVAFAVAPHLDPNLLKARLQQIRAAFVAGHSHELMASARAGIVASGTATVEAALLDMPMVVVYRLSPLTYTLGRPFVRVPHYAMANLIAGREVVKELIQKEFKPNAVVQETLRLLDDESHRGRVLEGLREVRSRLGGEGASARAAEVVARMLGGL